MVTAAFFTVTASLCMFTEALYTPTTYWNTYGCYTTLHVYFTTLWTVTEALLHGSYTWHAYCITLYDCWLLKHFMWLPCTLYGYCNTFRRKLLLALYTVIDIKISGKMEFIKKYTKTYQENDMKSLLQQWAPNHYRPHFKLCEPLFYVQLMYRFIDVVKHTSNVVNT